MNTSVEPPAGDSNGDFILAQVDPPHPLRNLLKPIVIAAIVLSLALAVYFYLIQRPPVAAGEVLQVNVYPVHTVISGGSGGNAMAGASSAYDQLIILAKLRIRNQTNIPLFLQEISQKITSPDGSQQVNLATGLTDFERVFQAYPTLGPLRADPLRRDITIDPGKSVEGMAIFNFPLTRQQWTALRSADVVISFVHQNNLVLHLPHQ